MFTISKKFPYFLGIILAQNFHFATRWGNLLIFRNLKCCKVSAKRVEINKYIANFNEKRNYVFSFLSNISKTPLINFIEFSNIL